MTLRFVIRPSAEADIVEAALWYELRSIGLGAEFLRAVDVCFAEIRRSPDRFSEVYKTIRRRSSIDSHTPHTSSRPPPRSG